MHTDKILYGGDYNPEQWLHMPEILQKDLEYFKKAHVNTVTLGVFSWGALEPREGEFHFEWLEQQIDTLYQNGISVILATPSGARPKWLADRYPEVLRVREDRRKMLFGGRENHCFTSPKYREKVTKIDRELAKRFGK
ncbi:MAG: beta-galactosidase, partial [bacterium]|nr:beta-galactosidase [bacterium]